MILRIYGAYKTGKTIYSKVLKPFYEELRKDACEIEDKRTYNRKRKSRKEKYFRRMERENSCQGMEKTKKFVKRKN